MNLSIPKYQSLRPSDQVMNMTILKVVEELRDLEKFFLLSLKCETHN